MLIIIDRKAPDEAKRNLQKIGRVVEFYTSGIVYDAISAHPDIFFYQYNNGLIVSPNLPPQFFRLLNSSNVTYSLGKKTIGQLYPQTATYNALFTSYGVLHNSKVSDPKVIASHPKTIHCEQAYTRCNAIQVGKTILTSDKGIGNVLERNELPSVYINPDGILLPGFKHGFLGGCCGILEQTLFVCGNLDYFSEKNQITNLVAKENFTLRELYNGPLLDVGGIFFFRS